MLGLSGKTAGFRLNHIPKRSTLSDANKKRDVLVFENIYHGLLKQYGVFLSDSRIKEVIKKQVKIFDSTTISLFKGIFKFGKFLQNPPFQLYQFDEIFGKPRKRLANRAARI